jgi:membrane fusion protein (multidrug efflux system)
MPDGSNPTNILVPPGTLSPKAAEPKRTRKHLMLALAGAVAVTGSGSGTYWKLYASHYVSTDDAYVGADSAQINAQVVGTIATVRVDNTALVHKGDVLATIDPADAQIDVARAEAEYQHTLQRVTQYFAQESAAVAQVSAREADLAHAKDEYDRRHGLAETGAVSAQEVSATRSAFDAARANLTSAEEQLVAARALTHGTTVETHPETAAARAALERAKLDLARTTIVAPIDGVVTQRNVQVGQRVLPGVSLMAVVPVQAAYVDANFKEVQLEKVHAGQPVKLVSDLYGDDVVYRGRVVGFSGGTGAAFAVVPAQNATGNWIKVVQRVPVRIAIEPAQLAEHPLRVGLSMTATIDTAD